MAAWPELAELKQALNVTSDEWDGDDNDTRLTALLNAAIQHVKDETSTDTDEPSDALHWAALRLAELMAQRPDTAAAITRGGAVFISDPAYQTFLYGARTSWGIG